jgi:hypothetical protein
MIINPASIYFNGPGQPDERQIRMYMDDMRRGRGISMPIVMNDADDRYLTVDLDSYHKIEAARRCGLETLEAYVLDNLGPEALARLRQELDQVQNTN